MFVAVIVLLDVSQIWHMYNFSLFLSVYKCCVYVQTGSMWEAQKRRKQPSLLSIDQKNQY